MINNISNYNCKEFVGSGPDYCDIKSEDCLTLEVPDTTKKYILRKLKDGRIIDRHQINVCKNCESFLNLPNC